MPGLVASAAATEVMPATVSVAFERRQEFPLRSNTYVDGVFQASVQGTVSRKRWSLSKRLGYTALQILRTFYDARRGKTEAFFFYDPYETSPKFTADPTGVATTGRYKARFDMDWAQVTNAVRSDVDVTLIEVG
jgi:hypothetical protein